MQMDSLAFVDVGDQFLITYACASHAGMAACLFNVGHAVELYLKAVILKAQPHTDVSKYGHNIKRLLTDVQAAVPSILPNYTLRSSAADKWLLNPVGPNGFGIDPDYDHYIYNIELYWISRFLVDTKYLFASHKAIKGSFLIFFTARNEYWQPFFREIRSYLGLPDPTRHYDRLVEAVNNPAIPRAAREYLSKVV